MKAGAESVVKLTQAKVCWGHQMHREVVTSPQEPLKPVPLGNPEVGLLTSRNMRG